MSTAPNAPQAWHSFWTQFGLPVYDENTVPETAAANRITYTYAEAEFESPVALSASLWYKSQSWEDISLMASLIYETIGLGGILVPYDTGKLWIKRGSPFSQRMSDEDEKYRRIYLNLEVEFLTYK